MTPSPRRRPADWSARALAALATISLALGVWGYAHLLRPDSLTGWLEVLYRSVQLFSLVFDTKVPTGPVPPLPEPLHPALHIARFGAFVTTIWAILKAFFPQVRRQVRLWRRRACRNHALILGYGPVGQAIGAALWQNRRDIRRVTAVHPAVTPELAMRARMDGVLLIEGDPSDPRSLGRVLAATAARLFVSDSDDLRAIDTAVAVERVAPGRDIRVMLNDSAVAAQMAEAVGTGFLGASGLRWFSVADETARLLIAEARFDRVAVETGRPRMHLVVVGCGSQGEAVAVEALLTGWRTRLGPPRITVIDRNAASVEARLQRRMPAWFQQPEGAALPEAARPMLDFLPCDAETLDFAQDPCLKDLRQQVSGWVFATGSEALNLRASLALHAAMTSLHLDPALIFVRIPSGHTEDAPALSGRPLTRARTFGALDDVIARSPLLTPDPDDLPRRLHAAYEKAVVKMGLGTESGWERLPETKRNANRALFRHAVMKIEDFGAEAQRPLYGVPIVDPGLAVRLRRIDGILDYGRIDRNAVPASWLKPGEILTAGDAEVAIAIRDAAVCEHNRWTVERALTRHVPTPTPDRSARNDTRRLHNNMHDWYALGEADTRRFDVVMIRALFEREGTGASATARPARVRTLILPVLAGGRPGPLVLIDDDPYAKRDVTELRVHLSLPEEPSAPAALVKPLVDLLIPQVQPDQGHTGPRRLRFDFARQPGEQTLLLANALAEAVRTRCEDRVAVEAHWGWRTGPGPTVGFAGHRDLTGFGDEARLLARLREAFARHAVAAGAEALVTGYAPGADRLAVSAWNALGLPLPQLVFPFVTSAVDGTLIWHTDDPDQATPDTAIAASALKGIGRPCLPQGGQGHTAQADHLLSAANLMIGVVREGTGQKPSGTADTLARAQARGTEVLRIGPELT